MTNLNTKLLKLSNSERQAIVPESEYERLLQYKYYVKGRGTGTNIQRYQRISTYKSKMISLASDVMNYPGDQFDHKDRDMYNNSFDNLRPSGYSQNMYNRKKFIKDNSTSKYKGVALDKRRGTWYAQIRVRRRYKYLGSFTNEIDAAKAYDKAALEFHGEFAQINTYDNATTQLIS